MTITFSIYWIMYYIINSAPPTVKPVTELVIELPSLLNEMNKNNQMMQLKVESAQYFIRKLIELDSHVHRLLIDAGFPEFFYLKRSGYMPTGYLQKILDIVVLHFDHDTIFKLMITTAKYRAAANILEQIGKPKTINEAILNLTHAIKKESPNSHFRLVTLQNKTFIQRVVNKETATESNWSELFTVIIILEMIRSFGASNWQPELVQLHSAYSDNLEPCFSKLADKIVYHQSNTEICLNDKLLSMKFLPSRYKNNDFLIEELQSNILNDTYTVIEFFIGESNLTVDFVAQLLNVSSRTLQRKLTEQNTNFKEIKDSVITDVGINLLTQGKYKISEIAAMLGYKNSPQFCRSFKRVTGISPNKIKSAYR